MLPGVNLLAQMLAEIKFDFSIGLQAVAPLTHLQHGLFSERLALMLCQFEAKTRWISREWI